MRRLTRELLTIQAAALAIGVCAASPAAAAETARVSDESTSTHWTYVKRDAPVRAKPAANARKVGSLRRRTYYRVRDVVLVLRETTEGPRWTQVRYPGLGRRTGWVPNEALDERRFFTDRQIVINRAKTRLRVMAGGRPIFSTRVVIGAAGSPTPGGRTYLRERIVPTERNGVYGVLAFGLSSYSPSRTGWAGGGQVGIHGTNQPGLIPGRISNGCVRLRNRAIRRMDRLTGVGTPVLVR